MSSYDFIIDGIRFSYSSTSTFTTCPWSFKLAYIDVVPRQNNFFAEYGTLIHECFERFFTDRLESYELSQYYIDNFDQVVVTPAPPTPEGMRERYKAQGLEFFNNFNFQKEKYDVLLVEDKINFERENIMLVAKPDLVLRDKETGKTGLWDYKTATPYRIDKRSGNEIADTDKIKGYHKQMYLYTYALREHKGIPIDYISLWYPRLNRIEQIPWNSTDEKDVMNELDKTIKNISKEEIFPYNNTSTYFCENLCGVRAFCEYR